MWSKEPGKDERGLYIAALVLLGAAVLLWVLAQFVPYVKGLFQWFLPCPIYALTGLYCPGCGGQRAVKALFQGDFLNSLYCHPFVLPALIYLIVFMGSHTLNRLSHRRIPALSVKNWHLYSLLGLLVLQWIVKNILLLAGVYHI